MPTNNGNVKFAHYTRAKFDVATKDNNTMYVVQESNGTKRLYQGNNLLSNNYTLPAAGSNNLGGIQIGYTQTGKNYPVQLSNNKAYVNVPWENDNTTYDSISLAEITNHSTANRVVKGAVLRNAFYMKTEFHDVAISGSYWDLYDRPAIMNPSDYLKLDGNSTMTGPLKMKSKIEIEYNEEDESLDFVFL